MNAIVEQRGSCLCGAVRVTATPKSAHIDACHCTICRKWGGGPVFAVECGTNVLFQGDEHITVYASSEWAERGFCRKCGTHLFYRLKDEGLYSLSAGLFDSDAEWHFAEQIFIDEKPAWYSFAEPTRNLTGAEVFAKYASGSE